MNVGKIKHWNAVNGLFKRCICVATVQALLLWSSFVTDRRLLSKQSINFKFKSSFITAMIGKLRLFKLSSIIQSIYLEW